MNKLIFFLVFIVGCTEGKKDKGVRVYQDDRGNAFLNADKIRFMSPGNGDTTINVKGKTGFLFGLYNTMKEKVEACDCNVTGRLQLFSKDTTLLDVWYSTGENSNGKKCQYLIIKEDGKNKCYPFTYQVEINMEHFLNNNKP